MTIPRLSTFSQKDIFQSTVVKKALARPKNIISVVYVIFDFSIISYIIQSGNKMFVKSTSSQKSQLPSISESKSVKDKVAKLIKNKIQPLIYKQYVLKSGKWANEGQNANNCTHTEKNNVQSQEKKKTGRKKSNNKQNDVKKSKDKRRKAIVQVQSSVLDHNYFLDLQSKVEKHIMLKKMDLMENQYTYAEECGKKQKQAICLKLRSSPMQKYLQIFERAQRPSEKTGKMKEASCQKMIQQIKSAKSIKHIEYVEENLKNLVNIESKHLAVRRTEPINIAYTELKLRKENRKLRNEIISDIHKQYEAQGSSKIRISINHKKMIQIL